MLKVNEIFYSLQGEGYFTGTPAVFVRLSGCNLRCPFCDTDHSPFIEMSTADIMSAVSDFPAKHLVITGGEPGLQIDKDFIDKLHDAKYFVQVETNGTLPLPENIDWITCSPKTPSIALNKVNELKVIFDGQKPLYTPTVEAQALSLQPLDTGNMEANKKITEATIKYILDHPEWRLSLQTHKLLDIR